MGSVYFATKSDWNKHLSQLIEQWNIYAPVREDENLSYRKIDDEALLDSLELDTARAVQPLKSFLFLYQEQVTNISKFPSVLHTVIMGVKGCDINSLQLLDKIFIEGDFVEPFYKRRRQDLILISCDCQVPLETCFCTLMGNNPHPTEGFDINLSFTNSGVILDVASEKGEEFINPSRKLFRKLTEGDKQLLVKREARRKVAKEKLTQYNSEFKIKTPFLEMLRKKLHSPVWEKQSETCVTCGACTQICPTCYCFILEDTKVGRKFTKLRTWDSCQYTGFARVAGGANPRMKVEERLRHRYLHKLDYLRETYGFDACTGCGRCVEVCLGKIDMRKVLSELKSEGT